MNDDNALGAYLRHCRARLDPASFGFTGSRRRTPGLRREEVAHLAGVSATWYTWLEQGRGGSPSAGVLERLAAALALSPVEREHLFLLAQNRPPEPRAERGARASERLQRLLDTFTHSPAYVRNATWDVVAWNRAATVVIGDYAALAPAERNVVRLVFRADAPHRAAAGWEDWARSVVGGFRADVLRAGAPDDAVAAFVAEMSAANPDFERLWNDFDVRANDEGSKTMHHPVAGPIAFDMLTFAVEGGRDLSMVVLNPVTDADRARVDLLLTPTEDRVPRSYSSVAPPR